MSRTDFRRRQSRRRRQKLARMSRHLPIFILLLAITVLAGAWIMDSQGRNYTVLPETLSTKQLIQFSEPLRIDPPAAAIWHLPYFRQSNDCYK